MDRPVLEFVVVAEPQRDASSRAVLAELAALVAASAGAPVHGDARTLDWAHDGALYRARFAGEGAGSVGFEGLDGCPCVLVRLDATECVVRTHLLPDENPMLALTIEDALSREGRAFEVRSEPGDASRASDAGEAKPAFPPLRAAGVSVPDRDPAGAARLVERVARLAARRLDAIRAVAARGTYV
ncbi:hypothetical protein [Sutterella megalosphaeroides]|uniref:Uncharacterized protein n=1 Tax=Sutterella megalosphaeroides TaxID=2494234 RepID=A0A2Z6IF58_9BURK|nr:hypothetical protein [Sutterella megalosphaeroides]BBF23848.1 hypothetical protein SUTMEG_17390 [Sutterella megalosphaeroides]